MDTVLYTVREGSTRQTKISFLMEHVFNLVGGKGRRTPGINKINNIPNMLKMWKYHGKKSKGEGDRKYWPGAGEDCNFN